MYENNPVHNFNVTHAGTKNQQVHRTFLENQGNTLINTEKMKVDEHFKQNVPLNSPYQNCMKTLLLII